MRPSALTDIRTDDWHEYPMSDRINLAIQHLKQTFCRLQSPFVTVNMGIGVIGERDQCFSLFITHDSMKIVSADHRDISQCPPRFLHQLAFSIGIGRLCDHRSMKREIDTIQRFRLLQAGHNHITTALVNFGVDDPTMGKANSDGGYQFYIGSLGTFHKTADKTLRL